MARTRIVSTALSSLSTPRLDAPRALVYLAITSFSLYFLFTLRISLLFSFIFILLHLYLSCYPFFVTLVILVVRYLHHLFCFIALSYFYVVVFSSVFCALFFAVQFLIFIWHDRSFGCFFVVPKVIDNLLPLCTSLSMPAGKNKHSFCFIISRNNFWNFVDLIFQQDVIVRRIRVKIVLNVIKASKLVQMKLIT